MISGYNADKPYAIKNIMEVLTKKLLMQGFIIMEHYDHFEQFQTDMLKWLKEGKVKYKEHVVNGIDNSTEAFLGLFHKILVNLLKFMICELLLLLLLLKEMMMIRNYLNYFELLYSLSL